MTARPSEVPQRGTTLDRVLGLLAATLLLSMAAAALHDVSYAWDVWYYHLPFASRLGGVLPPGTFVFHAANEARFAGFPLFGELLEGVLWRLSGRAECANLVAFVCVPMFAWFQRRRFRVPMRLSVIALLAIPLVHTHSTSSYVDLLANTAVSALFLLVLDSYVTRKPVDGRMLAFAGVLAAVAINTKVLAQPLVLVTLAALAARVLPPLVQELRGQSRGPALRTLAGIVLVLPLVFATPLKNAIMHDNPFYPVRTSVLGHALPGTDDPYSSSPPWLESAPEPVRFVCSILEIGIRPLSDRRRWTVDQWMPSDSSGNRMGGFFGAYVVFHLVLFAWRVAREARAGSDVETRARARVVAIGFGALTALTSLMPQAHELRYYLSWMMVLVALNLWLACRPGASCVPLGPRGIGLVSVVALGVVLAVTHGAYAYPSGSTFAELVREKVDDKTLATVHDGDRICVHHAPWNLLWAAAFHAPRQYVVKSAEEPSDCEGGYRLVE